MTASALLVVEGLTKRFVMTRSLIDVVRGCGRLVLCVCEGVSFVVRGGETLGIVGESGCGKSTLARCLVRLHEADSGDIRFDGLEVLALAGAERRAYNRRVQMIFQDPYGSLNPRLTVAEALGQALAFHGPRAGPAIGAGVRELLDLVGLPADAGARYPHEFSGGQRQRIGIARALAVEPECLVADEVVSALDVSIQAQIVNLLLDLQQRLH